MAKFKIIGKKEAKFFTYVEAKNATEAIMKLDKKEVNWLPSEGNSVTDGKELQIGQPIEEK